MLEERHNSYAKINLGLRVLNKRPDGYHNIATVFQEVSLCDELFFQRLREPGIELTVSDKTLPADQSNLVWKAIERLTAEMDMPFGVKVHIEKRIPAGGGLGGGSSNAATALRVVNQWMKNPLNQASLLDVGAAIGADVPFFLLGGTAFGEEKGEALTPLAWDIDYWICLICPGIHVSTAWAYQQVKIGLTKEEKITTFKALFQEVSPHTLGKLENDFEGMVFRRHPVLLEYKELLKEGGAFYAGMSGSGSSLFGLFESREQAETAKLFFQKEKRISACLCRPLAASER